MNCFYTELYYDKKHDEVVILNAGGEVLIGFNRLILSMLPADFLSFAKTVQRQKLSISDGYEASKSRTIIELPERGLKFLLAPTELKRLNTMLQLVAVRLKQQLLIQEFNKEFVSCFVESEVTIPNKRHRYLVDQAIQEMSKNGFQKDYSIVSLAKKIGSNETTLKQAFKCIMKTTIYKFYQDRRMNFATQRLKCGDSISDVSAEIGYSTVGHFSYAFKKHFGVCPSSYSKKL